MNDPRMKVSRCDIDGSGEIPLISSYIVDDYREEKDNKKGEEGRKKDDLTRQGEIQTENKQDNKPKKDDEDSKKIVEDIRDVPVSDDLPDKSSLKGPLSLAVPITFFSLALWVLSNILL